MNVQEAQVQTKRHSLIESVTNIIVGYAIALLAQIYFLKAIDVQVSLQHNVELSVALTVVSLVRSYALRRIFTKWTERAN